MAPFIDEKCMTPMPKQKTVKKIPKQPLTLFQKAGLVAAILCFVFPWFVEFPGLSPMGHRMFGLFLVTIVLWVTEAIPLFATAALVIFLEILFISDKAVIATPADFAPPAYAGFYHCLADPILMLFLGGFFLADGSAKFNLDSNLARVLLSPFGRSPKRILLGIMLITACFSMFMSNTATTATLMAFVLPVIAQLPNGDRMKAGLALAIPIAANIGGMGTPIGTPPNAIALGALNQAGYSIGFLKWMAMVVPLMLVILAFAWLLLVRLYPCSTDSLVLKIEGQFDRSRPAIIFYFTFVLTVFLWFTEAIHGMTSSVVGFFPVVVLLSTRVFSKKDLQAIPWHVLWLVAGGISLGKGVGATGLDRWLIGLVGWETLNPMMLLAVLAFMAMTVGSFISHSATANLLIPIGMSLALSGTVDLGPAQTAVSIAIGSSLAMALPISTPPNAIAFSTGLVKTREMAMVGVLIGLFGWAVYVYVASPLWTKFGLVGS
jgi:sodium-dependent dicarboxylate transporter 2/3/5